MRTQYRAVLADAQATAGFRTIADFRKDNAKAIRQSFLTFGKLCLKLGLYQRELLAVDGSKFRAVKSDKNVYTAEVLE
jgi:transposase